MCQAAPHRAAQVTSQAWQGLLSVARGPCNATALCFPKSRAAHLPRVVFSREKSLGIQNKRALHLHQFLLQHQSETFTRTVLMLQKPQPGHAGPFLEEHTKVCYGLSMGERVPFWRSSDCCRSCIFFIYYANEQFPGWMQLWRHSSQTLL